MCRKAEMSNAVGMWRMAVWRRPTALREEARRPVLEQRAGGKASGSVWPVKKCVPLLNISSLQLIPVNMIAYRSQYGSVNPAGIIAPAIVATAVVYCKIKGVIQEMG